MIKRLQRNKGTDRILNLSPWILGIACLLLLLLLAFFAVSNFRREKQLVEEALVQKTITLIRFINSSLRNSYIDDISSGNDNPHLLSHVQNAMELGVEQPGVDFILLTTERGHVLAGAGLEDQASQYKLSKEEIIFINSVKSAGPGGWSTRTVREGKKSEPGKFQIATKYKAQFSSGRGGRRQMMMRPFRRHPRFNDFEHESAMLGEQNPVYFIQLDLKQFSGPLQQQFIQIVIQLIAILLVGLGGSLSFLTLRGLKGSQRSLGEIRAFNDILVSSLPVGLIATDNNNIVQVCNDASSEILELSSRDVIGHPPSNIVATELDELFSDTADVQREKTCKISLGSGEKIVHFYCRPVYNENHEFAGQVLLLTDLTEVKSLEKELRRNERMAALGKMAAGVAHELRNPLSSIKGLAVLLKSKFSENSGEVKTADTLVKEVERLNRSIGELLDYAKPGQLNKKKCDINELIKKTVHLIEVDTSAYNITTKTDLNNSLPELSVDQDKLSQVLLNLLLNSIQATGHLEERGILKITTELEAAFLVISISDNGVGISADNLKRVFDPYFTTKPEGTGLGLALSLKTIEEHGGRIEIASQPNVITNVQIFLPVKGD